MSQFGRKNVLAMRPYVPGKPVDDVARELGMPPESIIKMASNENPLGPPKSALKVISSARRSLNLYPDDGCHQLAKAVSARLGVSEDSLIFGCGSTQIVLFLVSSFAGPGDEVLMSDQAFILYRLATAAADATRVAVPLKDFTHDLDAMASAVTPRTKCMFIANPNNPTGTTNTRQQVERFLSRIPDNVVVVFDEAYREYIQDPDYPDALEYIKAGKNVIMLRTFSKIYGLAGLRIGYAVGRPALISVLQKIHTPFGVNTLAQHAALAALEDERHLKRSVEVNERGKQYLSRHFTKMGLFHVPTKANFVFVDTGMDGKVLFEKLLREGVIVRPLKEYDFQTAVRITIGTPAQNARVVKALKKVLAGEGSGSAK